MEKRRYSRGSLRSSVFGLRSGRRGMTLLELLIVIALIGVLAGMLIPAFSKVREQGRRRQAETDIRVLESAIATYRMQQGHWPAPRDDRRDGIDKTYGTGDTDNWEVMRELLQVRPPVIDPERLSLDTNDNVLDPWKDQYRISLDLDGDYRINGADARYRVHSPNL